MSWVSHFEDYVVTGRGVDSYPCRGSPPWVHLQHRADWLERWGPWWIVGCVKKVFVSDELELQKEECWQWDENDYYMARYSTWQCPYSSCYLRHHLVFQLARTCSIT
jgi:hypothetical protein